MSRDDLPTVIPCLACGGDYEKIEELADGRYKATNCRWCTHGGMNREETLAFARHQRERRQSQGHE